MPSLESFLEQEPDTPFNSPRWGWVGNLLSLQPFKIALLGPGGYQRRWIGCYGLLGQMPSSVEADTKQEALQKLETKLLKRFPEFKGMLYPPPPKAALSRIWAEDDPF